ncbi:MAG: TetR/AcrR family transcriptional regulator [Rhodospirillaceae bacterium]
MIPRPQHNEQKPKVSDQKKAGYHHGDLKEALISAAKQLIQDKGPEGFSMAEACRIAGVSPAAPYRHFADRDELVGAVASQGFDSLTDRGKEERDKHPPGSVASIVALGQAYVKFAADEPAIFRLMFASHKGEDAFHDSVKQQGDRCFNILLKAVNAFQEAKGLGTTKTLDIALPLWTIVHGTACLLIDRDFDAVAPGTDPDELVRIATEGFLAGISTKLAKV